MRGRRSTQRRRVKSRSCCNRSWQDARCPPGGRIRPRTRHRPDGPLQLLDRVMNQTLDDAGFLDFGRQGWVCCDLGTRASAFLAIAGLKLPHLLLGVEGEPDSALIAAILDILENIDFDSKSEEKFAVRAQVGRFDALGFVRGAERRLLRGILEDEGALQVIPMYSCELTPDGRLPPLEDFRRWANFFSLTREPQPFFHFRMQGSPSLLNVKNWGTERFSTFAGFVRVLAGDSDAWIEVRNRNGQTLRLPDQGGWNAALERIRAHVGVGGLSTSGA